MSAQPDRVCGIETEYGITATLPGSAHEGVEPIHPMQLSNLVVRAYADATQPGRSGWDYATESPLRDLRGFEIGRSQAMPEQLTDVEGVMANVVLTNGARFYVDHAHPEYSGPEVTTAMDAVRWDRAGDAIMARAAALASERVGFKINLYKNNVDGKGASYGTHENYLLARATPFSQVVRGFTAFVVSRQVVIGAGRVGLGQASEAAGFQISQRADYFEAEVGLETTVRRPLINTRDEPHADPKRFRRLHVITGDATQAEWSTWLKVGTASLVLRALEAGFLNDAPLLAHPVPAMSQISHDPSCRVTVPDHHGAQWSAIDLQRYYWGACEQWCLQGQFGSAAQFAEAHEILRVWGEVLDQLARDPMELADTLEWVAKLQVLESYRARDGLGWDSPRLALIDVQFSDLDPAKGLAHTLMRTGRLKRLIDDAEVAHCIEYPPHDTRAWFRGAMMRHHAQAVVSASWDSLVLDIPGVATLRRLECADPLWPNRDVTEQLLATDSLNLLAAQWHTGSHRPGSETPGSERPGTQPAGGRDSRLSG